MSHATLDIHDIIGNKRITTHLQPLISARRGLVMGYEALSRGFLQDSGLLIPPDTLFTLAQARGLRLDLDRACREKALSTFAPLHKAHRDILLFVNVDASLLTNRIVGSGHIDRLTHTFGITPGNIVIEVIESHVEDSEALERFIDRYRSLGFLIALDDVGAGHSNLERIATLKPDIIKIDRSLVQNIDSEFYRQEVVGSLTSLAKRIGAMTVAEGVERVEEAVHCMGAGVDVLQGFLFSRPRPAHELTDVIASCTLSAESSTSPTMHSESTNAGSPIKTNVETNVGTNAETSAVHHRQKELCDPLRPMKAVAKRYREFVLELLAEQSEKQQQHNALIDEFRAILATHRPESFNKVLVDSLVRHENLECLYILDGQGMQVSDSICNPFALNAHKRFIYQPARLGTDHSLKEYFLPIQSGLEECVTAPYISLASGSRCITLAARVADRNGTPYVLCLDIAQERGVKTESLRCSSRCGSMAK